MRLKCAFPVICRDNEAQSPILCWLHIWSQLVPLVRDYHGWIQRNEQRWPLSLRRRVPSAFYSCERLQSQLALLLQSPSFSAHVAPASNQRKASKTRSGRDQISPSASSSIIDVAVYQQIVHILVEDWMTGKADNANSSVDQVDKQAEARDSVQDSSSRQQSRRRLRSRNPFIDAELTASRSYNDTFADLEDFIVCKRGRRY